MLSGDAPFNGDAGSRVNGELEMARKKSCPNCGSKKARKKGTEWMCGTCGKTWSDKDKRSGSRKEKTRFSGG